jgi:predicted amino acid racemase
VTSVAEEPGRFTHIFLDIMFADIVPGLWFAKYSAVARD